MGFLDKISKAIQAGKIDARQEQQAKASQEASVAEQCSNFEDARNRSLDAAHGAQQAGDVKGYERYSKRAERNAKAIEDAHSRIQKG